MSDRIILSNMLFNGRHGVRESEQQAPQPFQVDVELSLDLRPAGMTDDLTKTLNYELVFDICRQVVESTSYRLIEALAEAIAQRVLTESAAIDVCVRVRKPRVGLPGALDYAGVEIHRRRSDALSAS